MQVYQFFEALVWLALVGAFLALEFAGGALIRSSFRPRPNPTDYSFEEFPPMMRRTVGVVLMLLALFFFGIVGLQITTPRPVAPAPTPTEQTERS